jgi:hypothetical protein
VKITLTRRRELRINLGNFEHCVDTGEVSIEVDDDLSAPAVDVLTSRMNKRLDMMVEDDIRDLVAAQGNEDSFIFTWASNKGIK